MMVQARDRIRMIYFAAEGVFSPVLDSQVIVPLKRMGHHAPEITRALLILTSVRHARNAETARRLAAVCEALPGVNVIHRFRLPKNLPLEASIWSVQLRQAIRACGYAGDAPIIVHCRGQFAGAAAARLKRRDSRLRILLDVRGALEDEVQFAGILGRYLRYQGAASLAEALAGADGLNTVTQRLADHVRMNRHLTRHLPSAVVGCCVDTKRFRFDPAVRTARRKELGLEKEFVVCYCGAMSHWQRPDALADAFAAIRAEMPDARFLVLTREAKPLRAELARAGVRDGDVTICSAPHRKVASFMMAGEVGLLLREDILSNHVASPVKFAEYLRCGLPVILTPYIGDFGAFVTAHGVGQTVGFPIRAHEVAAAARALRTRLEIEGETFRRRCSQVAGEYLSWDAQGGKLIALYRGLGGPARNGNLLGE
ncbi:MAG: glycosyltransferase [Phycisphaerae bacterium]|nr:glycosyltransferase [Phycisphaerae bacterium]